MNKIKKNYPPIFPLAITALCSVTAIAGFVDQTATYVPGGINAGNDHICIIDFNNDGYLDFNNDSHLYRSNHGTNFSFVATANNYIWGDYNNDGLADRIIWHGNGYLQKNNSTSGTSFTTYHDNSVMPILPPVEINGTNYWDSGNRQGACWGDWNGDGFLDLYIPGYELSYSDPSGFPDAILMNNSGSSFSMTIPSGSDDNRARGVSACDFDEDGDQDIFVSCYRLRKNNLLLNDGSGNFTDVATARGVDGDGTLHNDRGHTIGSCWGDFNNDGYFDIFVGNFAHPDASQDRPMLMQNSGPGGGYTFTKIWTIDGSDYQESYCNAAAADYDNDGDLDIFFTTVYSGDNSRLWRNNGNGTFTDVTTAVGLPSDLGRTYSAAWGDLNYDGFPDLITNNKIFINEGNGNNWLKVKLLGDGNKINRMAIGAIAKISTIPGKTLIRQIEGASGKANQNEMTLHFGVGTYSQPVDVEIIWPNGAVQTMEDVALNQSVTYAAPAAMTVSTAALTSQCMRTADAGSQSFTVQSTSLQPMDFSVSDDAAWLTLSPTSGTCTEGAAETVQVNYDTDQLAAGTYNANITISSADVTNTPQVVSVTLTVTPHHADMPIAESFEPYSVGQSLVGVNGWTGDAGFEEILQMSYAVQTPPGYPLPFAEHTKVYETSASIARSVNAAVDQNVNVDFMLKTVRNEELPSGLGNSTQTGFATDSNGVLHVWHMYHDGAQWTQRWSSLGIEPVADNQWLRISVVMDYSSSPAGDTFFCPRVNGSLCPTQHGYKAPDNLVSAGPWYMCADSPGRGAGGNRRITGFSVEGSGCLDDLVISTNSFAHSGTTTTNGVPFAWFDSMGIGRNPGQDFDGDGFSALSEYLAGTDPSDGDNSFRIVKTWTDSSRVYIQFLGNDSGDATPYIVEGATNGLAGGWSILDSSVPRVAAPAVTNTWSGPLQPSGPAFYRIKAVGLE